MGPLKYPVQLIKWQQNSSHSSEPTKNEKKICSSSQRFWDFFHRIIQVIVSDLQLFFKISCLSALILLKLLLSINKLSVQQQKNRQKDRVETAEHIVTFKI